MLPELFEIPVLHVTIKSYGLMMAIGFVAGLALIRRLARDFAPDGEHVTNAALIALIAGVVGARIFFIIHHFDQFQDRPLEFFAVWSGGLELLGGVLPAIAAILLYLRLCKLPMRHYCDVLAIGLMLGLSFGRIGCFLNADCFGRPTELPWGVRFPYGSFVYRSQIYPDFDRNRTEPYLQLPADFFGYHTEAGDYVFDLKPIDLLTPEQRRMATEGRYRALPVHPTQLYTSVCAAAICWLLVRLWRRSRRAEFTGVYPPLTTPGSTYSLMFVLYGVMRFSIECLRDDNPFEIDGLTVSQLICLGLIPVGAALLIYFARTKPETVPSPDRALQGDCDDTSNEPESAR